MEEEKQWGHAVGIDEVFALLLRVRTSQKTGLVVFSIVFGNCRLNVTSEASTFSTYILPEITCDALQSTSIWTLSGPGRRLIFVISNFPNNSRQRASSLDKFGFVEKQFNIWLFGNTSKNVPCKQPRKRPWQYTRSKSSLSCAVHLTLASKRSRK